MSYITNDGMFMAPDSGIYVVQSQAHLPSAVRTPDVLWRVRMLQRRKYVFNLNDQPFKYLFALCFNLQLHGEDSFRYRK